MGACFVLAVPFLVLLVITYGGADMYTIAECSSDGYIDVRENTGTNITCDGIQNSASNIYWALSGNRIGDCGQPCGLTDPHNIDYELSRPHAGRSVLRIIKNFRPKALQTLTCSQRNNRTAVSCVINSIYPGEITSPVVNTDAVTWTVKASYRVEKVYSSRKQYRCIWTLQSKQNITTETNMTDMESFNMSGDTYYRGNCSFSWTLPTTEGTYMFWGMFVPGTRDVFDSVGTIKIEHPGDPTLDCGSRPVVETGNLTCRCRLSSTKPGRPAPSVSWPGFSDSSDLTLVNISRSDNGTHYTCQLTWGPNATIVNKAVHTIQLDIYGPSRVYIFNATELFINQPVRLVCRAEDVYPSASFRWTGVTCDSVIPSASTGPVNCTDGCMHKEYDETLNENVCEFTSSLKDRGKEVSCTATNAYTGTLFASATWRIDFTVPGELEATKTGLALPVASIGGGVGAAIAVIIIAVIVVIVIVRRKRQSKRTEDNENINTDNHDEPRVNIYELPSPRRNEDAYLYTDLTPSVTSSPPYYAARDYKGSNSVTEQGSTEGQGINTYEHPSARRNEDGHFYTDLSSAPGGVARIANEAARD